MGDVGGSSMKELFRYWLIGTATIGVLVFLGMVWNHGLVPLFMYSKVFRLAVLFTLGSLFVTWVGFMVHEAFNPPVYRVIDDDSGDEHF